MTALRFGGVPGVAVLGGDLSQLRRRGGWWRLRDWRLGTKLTAVLLIPLLLAGVLGGLRVADSVREADHLRAAARQVALAQLVGVAVHDLQRERHLVLAEAITPGTTDRIALPSQIQRVDIGITALRSAASGTVDLGPAAADAHRAALARLNGISALRRGALGPAPAPGRVLAGYTELIADLLELHRAMLGGAGDPLRGQAEGLVALATAKEQLSAQHAVLLAAMLSGDLSPERLSALRTEDVRFDAAIERFGDAVPPGQLQRYAETVTGDAVDARRRLLDGTLLDGAQLDGAPGGEARRTPADWDAVAAETADRIRQVETALLGELLADTKALGERVWYEAIRDAAVVAVLLVLAVVLLVVVVRSLLRPLRALRSHAFTVADRRLPAAVEQLGSTDDKIGETTVDPVPVYSQEEVGQVARAFDTVHVQAVRLAAEQAMLRSTINDIFLNLAGRSQHLVERQLKLIDKLESGEQDPQQLSNLFQLDHLATRMRRNSENLLVLAGGELHRDAESGISVLDLLRAAVSEIAEYRRVTLRRPPVAIVAGPAAGDLVHLIAELLDNATSASPPDTPVAVRSGITEEGGLLVEIIDGGTGLPPGELNEINERLASAPAPDASVSHQMGLFVVGKLAARHQIRVRLRQQRGDVGITAAVLLPPSLVAVESWASSAEPLAAPFVPPSMSPSMSTTAAFDGEFGTAWSAANGEVPLRVCVVEGEAEEDQLSPSSIGGLMTVRRRRPRTAEEEWFELFGHDEPRQGPVRVPPTGSATVTGVPEPGAVAGVQREVHEEIFEAVSAWFLERRSASPERAVPERAVPDGPVEVTTPRTGPSRRPVPTALDWRSAGDEGWHAAKVLRTRVDFEVTAAGLPRRRPGAHLMPGSAGPVRLGPASGSNGTARTAQDVRGRLSSYQWGLRHGRQPHVSPGNLAARSHARQGHPEEGSQ